MTSQSQGVALITGASGGMGAVYADRLARRGYDLILVARDGARLAAVAEAARAATGRAVETLRADLSRTDELAALEARLRTDPAISMLVNNAGVGSAKPLLEADVEAMSRMIALNVAALMRLTYAAAPAFVARGGGTIINMASIVGVAPEILNGVYGGTKAFVLALTRSLQHELGDRGLRVQAVLPGAVGTDFWDLAGTPLTALPESIVMTPADAVDAALAGLDQGELFTLPALPDIADWDAFEAARLTLMPNLSRAEPASRYRIARVPDGRPAADA